MLHAPEPVIVDEAHGAAMAKNQNQQQRHEFLQQVARDENRHLILLTAIPHSGIESALLPGTHLRFLPKEARLESYAGSRLSDWLGL